MSCLILNKQPLRNQRVECSIGETDNVKVSFSRLKTRSEKRVQFGCHVVPRWKLRLFGILRLVQQNFSYTLYLLRTKFPLAWQEEKCLDFCMYLCQKKLIFKLAISITLQIITTLNFHSFKPNIFLWPYYIQASLHELPTNRSILLCTYV